MTPEIDPDAGMVRLPGGSFLMGSDRHYPDEGPSHRVKVSPFRIARTAVTNAQFARFVTQTGYVTVAERPLDPAMYPGALPELLVPGALVFTRPPQRVDVRNIGNWWSYVPGANWRHPLGPGSSVAGLDDHPVVQVAYEDAEAYAAWAGLALPTEAEWEFAARGGLDGAEFVWGDELTPGGQHMANTWQGEFPWQNLCTDGYERTAPVAAYQPNGYGLYQMAGNVWEWTADWYRSRHAGARAGNPCCIPQNPRGADMRESYDSREPESRIPRKVLKGGSYLCAPNYCQRYRPAARYPQPVDTATCHVGFRCVKREDPPGQSCASHTAR
ncbi:formylglycine-generating enzyme family protein [Cupriavidus pinatubonensis]|uniref:formylglycine-generating enzyme family protein n=1 Tax=Cupriavidus pinatubonensis TaxID=248026 RepID=UPI001FD44A8F|nr:formylglycine-generating enzyme family protein [Cupriavidus pinatubonensis]